MNYNDVIHLTEEFYNLIPFILIIIMPSGLGNIQYRTSNKFTVLDYLEFFCI